MAGYLAQLGVKDESTYGTPVTVDRFFEFNAESLKLDMGRVESKGHRTGGLVMRSDRTVPYRKGAGGDVALDVLSKGFGFWLKHMLGSVATAGPTDSAYTHTGTIGYIAGDSFTAQVGRAKIDNTVQPFTYHGCKVASWKLACNVDGLLVASLSIDAEDEDTSTSLATASYPASMEPLSFVGGTIEFDAGAVDVFSAEVACNNNLWMERRFQRASGTLKKEPIDQGDRQVTWSCDAEFDSTTHYDKFRSATMAGMYAAVTMQWTALGLIGATSVPTVLVTLPKARFDAAEGINVAGTGRIRVKYSGPAHFDGTNSAVTVAYTTADATP